MADTHVNTGNRQSLAKELGLIGVFSIASGAMISSGLFVLPGIVFATAGPSIIVAYALASLLCIPVLVSKMELVTAMPRSGAAYFHTGRSLGLLAGTVAGFSNWAALSLKTTFAMVGLGALAGFVFPEGGEYAIKAGAVASCLVFFAINLIGTREAGRLQNLLVIILIGILCAYCLGGVNQIQGERYMDFVPHGWTAMLLTVGMIFVAYGGLTAAVDVAEEVRNPSRNLPLGMLAAFLIVSALYIFAVYVTVGLVPPDDLAGSLAPIAEGAFRAIGRPGRIAISIAAFTAFATTANGGLLSASRSPMAMSRDGLLPRKLAQTHQRFGTPHIALITTTLFIITVILFLSIENLVKFASSMMLLIFIFDNISLIIMRQSKIQNYRPTFRAPLYPWLQVVAIVLYGMLILEMGALVLSLTFGLITFAMIWYLVYVETHIEYESAFIHLVKQIVTSSFGRAGLEDELRQLTLERDDVTLDRFDLLVNNCVVLDIKGSMSAKEAFSKIAEALAERISMDKEELYQLFLKRERESSTMVRPGLAVPHIIVEGKDVFEMVLVRCIPGIEFSELNPPVTAAFVLAGSMDQRNFHLRALMNIAHIVEEEHFKSKWAKATDEQMLRDLVLLAHRPRQ
ncbi:MAG TPA: amino acid permease [Candidatus Hydrogenedentes bacterium]|nr:amino acid permease [Candidatus Hydrogenedentota bacterium]